ncbi:MAG: DUF4038 domain-containing protein [Chitinophagaceae bacterium]
MLKTYPSDFEQRSTGRKPHNVLAIVTGALLFLLILSVAGALKAMVKDTILKTKTNMVVELTFIATRDYPDPFNQVVLDAIFTDPKGREFRVPGFWDGNNKWKVRYSSPVIGTHRFRSVSSEAGDNGLNGVTGRVVVQPYKGKNLLLIHGALRIADDKRHFAYGDGTPFFWLGDTWWMGLTKRLSWPEDVKVLAADRSKKGFNVIQIVAGLYPDMPAFDERGENEAGFPWERDYSRIRPEYFKEADKRIMYLAEQGFVPCIVGAWGYHLEWLGEEKLKKHWRYIIARWGALPVVWVAAGETTMPFYLSTSKEADTERQKKEWTNIMRYMKESDPFHRLITSHPSRTARASVTDPLVLDFDMHQSGHGSPGPKQAAQALEGWKNEPVMPVMSGESRYEALAIPQPLPAAAARQAFWAHTIYTGFAGHTYGANGVWQVNGRDKPYGKSPGGNNWGVTPWNEAMQLPGSAQLGFARKLIESLPAWNKLAPFAEGVSSDSAKLSPLCAADGDRLRVVYILSPGNIKVRSLVPGSKYNAYWFNPVTGEKQPGFTITANNSGESNAVSPSGEQDWVLIIQNSKVKVKGAF